MPDNIDEQKHFSQSPDMIFGKTRCCGNTPDELGKMDIDRRWENDNRIPTWNFGVVNFSFSHNFMQNGNSVCATDDEMIKIVDNNMPDGQENIGTRQIKHNGQGFIF